MKILLNPQYVLCSHEDQRQVKASCTIVQNQLDKVIEKGLFMHCKIMTFANFILFFLSLIQLSFVLTYEMRAFHSHSLDKPTVLNLCIHKYNFM